MHANIEAQKNTHKQAGDAYEYIFRSFSGYIKYEEGELWQIL